MDRSGALKVVKKLRRKRPVIIGTLLLFLAIWFYFILPKPLFTAPYSTVVLDRNGALLGARLAADEQWRFPIPDSLPHKFQQAILTQEDRYFNYHLGVNPVALVKALWRNIKEGEVQSGASTISMQVIRLSRNNPPRTLSEKIYEMLLATRMELGYSKKEILGFYAAHAPFGGNVVGLEAAAWRYFNRSAFDLSWAESATLAVLPNAPGLIHPGRNRDVLLQKRNKLLKQLWQGEHIDEETYKLALLEEIPNEPAALPQYALHATALLHQQEVGKRYVSTLNMSLQKRAQQLVDMHLNKLRGNQIQNGSLLLVDNHSGEVLSYVGNTSKGKDFFNDMNRAPRSSGSILKPFLYASMLSSGELLPNELVADVPTFLGGFKPENFVEDFDGAVPASEALARSLNIPAVLELQKFGVDRFLRKLQQMGFSTVNRTPDHYGLSLILGGAEVTAWDLGRGYYQMAAQLLRFNNGGDQQIADIHLLQIADRLNAAGLNEGAVYETFEVLKTLNRPDSEMGWKQFGNAAISWKTGTSFGFRDAWAVGVTPNYTCVVWVGNASGEGRPGLIGAQAAGPLLFSFLNELPVGKPFQKPFDAMVLRKVCRTSGLLAAQDCPFTDSVYLPEGTKPGSVCSYHTTVFTDFSEQYRLSLKCATADELHEKKWFVLPPAQAWYYAKKHGDYKVLPPYRAGCGSHSHKSMEIIYPRSGSRIFIPRELSGEANHVILEVAHQNREEVLYWHLNGSYLGETQTFHQIGVDLPKGTYTLLVEDGNGNTVTQKFEVVEKD